MSATPSLAVDDRIPLDNPRPKVLWTDVVLRWVDKLRWPLILLLLVGYFLAFNGQWQLEPDSALYLALGRNIAAGRGYTFEGLPHELAYPGFPYFLAAFFKSFDFFNALFAINIAMVVLGLLTLALTYRLIYLYSDRRTAVLITFMVGLSRIFARYCFEIMTDIPFLLGTMAVLAGYEAIFTARATGRGKGRWYDWIILIAGLAIAISTRPTMIALVLAALLATAWESARGRLPKKFALAGIATIAIVVALFFLFDPRHGTGNGQIQSYEQWAAYALTHNFDSRLQVLDENLKLPFVREIFRSVFGMPVDSSMAWVEFLGGISIVISGVAITAKRPLWGFWIIITFLMLLIFISLDRYVLEILPVLMIAGWEGLRWLDRKMRRPWGNLLAVALLTVAIVLNGIQFVTIIYRQHQHPFLQYYKEGRFPGYIAMAHQLTRLTTRDDLTFCAPKYSRILAFLGDRLVVEGETPGVDFSRHRLFVILDPVDPDLRQLLEDKHIHTVGQPIITEKRAGLRPPLTLWHAEIDPGAKP